MLAATALRDGSPHRVQPCGVGVVLIRRGEEISAFGADCPHLGAPLSEGWLHRDALVCPWHGSRFDASTGCVIRGPATAPLPRFDARVRDGTIEVRRRPQAPRANPDSVLAHEQQVMEPEAQRARR